MSEWLKEHDWKSCMFRKGHRGFESLSLHHVKLGKLVKGSWRIRQIWKEAAGLVNFVQVSLFVGLLCWWRLVPWGLGSGGNGPRKAYSDAG